jgi:type VI secretion system ImpM family protein
MAENYLRLGCIGKLPCYGDYLKVGVHHPTARALLELMLTGKQQLALDDSLAEAYNSLEAYKDVAIDARLRILFGLPGSKELLVGVLRPSRDAGGRHFPFVAFTQLVRRNFGRHYAMLPMALAPIWDALGEAWESLAEATTLEAFEETVESIEFPELMGAKDASGDFRGRQQEDAGKLFEGGASRSQLAQGMPELLQRLGKGGEQGMNVEFPVAAELAEACFDVSVWLELLNNQFRMKRVEPSVFLDEQAGVTDRRVLLRFGPPEPADYIAIVGGPGSESWIRPADPGPEGAADVTVETASISYGSFLSTRF